MIEWSVPEIDTRLPSLANIGSDLNDFIVKRTLMTWNPDIKASQT